MPGEKEALFAEAMEQRWTIAAYESHERSCLRSLEILSKFNHYGLISSVGSYTLQQENALSEKHFISFRIADLAWISLYAYWDAMYSRAISIGIGGEYVGRLPMTEETISDKLVQSFPSDWTKQGICTFFNELIRLLPLSRARQAL